MSPGKFSITFSIKFTRSEVANVDEKGGYGVPIDVWALGITAIELAECQPPFFELAPMRVLHMLTKSSYKPPKLKDKKKWSPIFHNFVKSCLVKKPNKRPLPSTLLQVNFKSKSLNNRFRVIISCADP
jgi:serine/threonine protein kinase